MKPRNCPIILIAVAAAFLGASFAARADASLPDTTRGSGTQAPPGRVADTSTAEGSFGSHFARAAKPADCAKTGTRITINTGSRRAFTMSSWPRPATSCSITIFGLLSFLANAVEVVGVAYGISTIFSAFICDENHHHAKSYRILFGAAFLAFGMCAPAFVSWLFLAT